jgi:hypothetical protein
MNYEMFQIKNEGSAYRNLKNYYNSWHNSWMRCFVQCIYRCQLAINQRFKVINGTIKGSDIFNLFAILNNRE